jgi:hypothetical protein
MTSQQDIDDSKGNELKYQAWVEILSTYKDHNTPFVSTVKCKDCLG